MKIFFLFSGAGIQDLSDLKYLYLGYNLGLSNLPKVNSTKLEECHLGHINLKKIEVDFKLRSQIKYLNLCKKKKNLIWLFVKPVIHLSNQSKNSSQRGIRCPFGFNFPDSSVNVGYIFLNLRDPQP